MEFEFYSQPALYIYTKYHSLVLSSVFKNFGFVDCLTKINLGVIL